MVFQSRMIGVDHSRMDKHAPGKCRDYQLTLFVNVALQHAYMTKARPPRLKVALVVRRAFTTLDRFT